MICVCSQHPGIIFTGTRFHFECEHWTSGLLAAVLFVCVPHQEVVFRESSSRLAAADASACFTDASVQETRSSVGQTQPPAGVSPRQEGSLFTVCSPQPSHIFCLSLLRLKWVDREKFVEWTFSCRRLPISELKNDVTFVIVSSVSCFHLPFVLLKHAVVHFYVTPSLC